VLLDGFGIDELRLVREESTGEDGKVRVSAHYHVEARRR
jgi:hypothetical protein